VGEEVKRTPYGHAHRQEYRRKVQLCLDVFETMLAKPSFELDRPLTGLEIECILVDADYQPGHVENGDPGGAPSFAHTTYPVNGMVGQAAGFAASHL
jgi:hypothetical protein